jgi:hypothetical protein
MIHSYLPNKVFGTQYKHIIWQNFRRHQISQKLSKRVATNSPQTNIRVAKNLPNFLPQKSGTKFFAASFAKLDR